MYIVKKNHKRVQYIMSLSSGVPNKPNCLYFKFAIKKKKLNTYLNHFFSHNYANLIQISPIKAKRHKHSKAKSRQTSLFKQTGVKVTHPHDPHH